MRWLHEMSKLLNDRIDHAGCTVPRIEVLTLLERAAHEYEQRLRAVGPDAWKAPSICDRWTVKKLADHVVGGNRYAVALLDGKDSAQAFEESREAGFDDAPIESFRQSAEDQLAAFGAPGALQRDVQHVTGEMPASQLLVFRLGELLIHGWDLARSTGGDEHMDAELTAIVWDVWKPLLGVVESNRFGGPSGAVADDAPLALRLLDLTGRRP